MVISRGTRASPHRPGRALLAFLAAAASLFAPARTEAADLTRIRRDRLVAELRAQIKPGERGVFLLAGSRTSEEGEYRQDPDFFHLTGLDVPDAFLALVFDASTVLERLYLAPGTPDRLKWIGETLGPGRRDKDSGRADPERLRAAEATGFRGDGREPGSGIAETGDLKPDLREFLAGPAALFLRAPPSEAPDGGSPEEFRSAEARAANPAVRLVSAAGPLGRSRLIKSPEEIDRIRRATTIACEAHRAAMRAVRPGVKEYEVEAEIEYVFTRSGARLPAYPTMVGSGPNACVLHYGRNEGTIGGDDMVLIDAGPEYQHYAADLSRTLPASGRFTPEQIRIYRAVLRAQREAAALVRPGSRLRDVCDRATRALDQEGLKSRIQHGCGHFVGLEVHDPGGVDTVLAAGMVLTIEPGVYVPESGICVRVEDIYLVTETGGERISTCLPEEPEAIEAEMAGRKGSPALSPDASTSPRR